MRNSPIFQGGRRISSGRGGGSRTNAAFGEGRRVRGQVRLPARMWRRLRPGRRPRCRPRRRRHRHRGSALTRNHLSDHLQLLGRLVPEQGCDQAARQHHDDKRHHDKQAFSRRFERRLFRPSWSPQDLLALGELGPHVRRQLAVVPRLRWRGSWRGMSHKISLSLVSSTALRASAIAPGRPWKRHACSPGRCRAA
jgi:hypothetical protein